MISDDVITECARVLRDTFGMENQHARARKVIEKFLEESEKRGYVLVKK